MTGPSQPKDCETNQCASTYAMNVTTVSQSGPSRGKKQDSLIFIRPGRQLKKDGKNYFGFQSSFFTGRDEQERRLHPTDFLFHPYCS